MSKSKKLSSSGLKTFTRSFLQCGDQLHTLAIKNNNDTLDDAIVIDDQSRLTERQSTQDEKLTRQPSMLKIAENKRKKETPESRIAAASNLPLPINLTKGQATQDEELLRFESNTSKTDTESGSKLRENFAEQNLLLHHNFDRLIDKTGVKIDAENLADIGFEVDKALTNRMKVDRRSIRKLYRKARRSPGGKEKVETKSLAKLLNKKKVEKKFSNLLQYAENKALEVGILQKNANNKVIPHRDNKMNTVNNIEELRKGINIEIDKTDKKSKLIGAMLKRAIDKDTRGTGGKLYAIARSARTKFSKNYHNVALVKKLVNMKHNARDDRITPLDQILDQAIFATSADYASVRHIKKLLNDKRYGNEGKLAWGELQAGAIAHIKNTILNTQSNKDGYQIVSLHKFNKIMLDLEKTGKLELVFDKDIANNLRNLNRAARSILNMPPDVG